MLELIPAAQEDRALLFNLNQKYLYEMTNFYDDPMDAEGNYHYGHFEAYFTDPARTALLIYSDGRLAGFAMLHPLFLFRRIAGPRHGGVHHLPPVPAAGPGHGGRAAHTDGVSRALGDQVQRE